MFSLTAQDLLLLSVVGLTCAIVFKAFLLRTTQKQAGSSIPMVDRLDMYQRYGRMGTFEIGPENGDIWCDAGLLAIYGIDADAGAIPREVFLERVHPDDRDLMERAFQDGSRSGRQDRQRDRMEIRAFGPEDSDIRVQLNWIAEQRRNGRTAPVVAVHRTVSEEGPVEREHLNMSPRLPFEMRYSGMGMFEHERGSDHALCDQGMIDIYGLDHKPGMVPVADWIALIHPEDLPGVMDALQTTWSKGHLHERIDFRAIRPNGAIRFVRANWLAETDKDGKPLRLVGTHSDLTGIREAEEERLEARERLDLISDNLPGAVIQREFVDGKLGALIHVSPNAEMIWGYSAEEILADPQVLVDAHDPASQPIFQKKKEAALKTRVPLTYRYRITTRTGETKWVEYRGSPPRKRDDNKQVVEAIFLDVTQEVENRRTIELIVENLPGVVFQSECRGDGQSRLRYISPKCVDIWGYTDEELYADIGHLIRAHDPGDTPVFLQDPEKGNKTGEPVFHRYRITARDGQKRWLEFRGNGTRNGGKLRYEAIVLDVTQEVEAQQQLEREREIAQRAQKNESIGHLTGGIAHDFNNLLAVILGNLELLTEEEDPAIRMRLTDTAIASTLRGADLTRNMLSFARRARLEPEVIDINDVVRHARNWIGRTLPESISVETSLLAGLWKVDADPSSLESAFLNLVLNARYAMDGKGRLTVETANLQIDEDYIESRKEELKPGRYVMLAVSDTGHGIAKDDLERVFEPFFTTKPPGVGTGLGLSMVVGYMRQSGGTVRVYSEPGEGTTFKLFFPISKEENTVQAKPVVPVRDASAEGQRILLVEDDEAVRSTLDFTLKRAGYRVTQAISGDSALEIFEADPFFDLVLTDIVMPGELQGTALSHKLREIRGDLPIVFMSGYSREATVHGNGLRPGGHPADETRAQKRSSRRDCACCLERFGGWVGLAVKAQPRRRFTGYSAQGKRDAFYENQVPPQGS